MKDFEGPNVLTLKDFEGPNVFKLGTTNIEQPEKHTLTNLNLPLLSSEIALNELPMNNLVPF